MKAELTGTPNSLEIAMVGVADDGPSTVSPRQLLDIIHAGRQIPGLAVTPKLSLWELANVSAQLVDTHTLVTDVLPVNCQWTMLGVAAGAFEWAILGASVLGRGDNRDRSGLTISRNSCESKTHENGPMKKGAREGALG